MNLNKHSIRVRATLIIIASLFLLLTGCKDGEQLQSEVEQALTKQQEVMNYRFTGNAEITLDMTLPKASHLLTHGLFTLVKSSKLTWDGVASTDPARLEIDLALTPLGSSEAYLLPILLKDNKLYFNIPLLSAKDQFYVMDMDQLSQTSKRDNPLTPDKIKNAGLTTAKIMNILVTGLDSKWFEESKKDSQTAGNDKTISIKITEKNQSEIITSLFSKLPDVMDELQTSGFITAVQEEEYKQKLAKEENKLISSDNLINKPWTISVSINDEGFVNELVMDLNYTLMDDNGKLRNNRIYLQNRFDEINKNPKFQKEIPQNLVNFEDMLNKLNPSAP